MPLRREPVLQLNSKNLKRSHPNSSQFDRQIGFHKTNIEALVGQAVGELLDENSCCDSCAKLDGKFANCVRVPGMIACPNCHFDRQGIRCSFAKEKKEANVPIRRKRGLEAMLEEMSNLYDLECKKLKLGEAPRDIVAKKRRLAMAIMEEVEGIGVDRWKPVFESHYNVLWDFLYARGGLDSASKELIRIFEYLANITSLEKWEDWKIQSNPNTSSKMMKIVRKL
ncbi:unnamed protein product [Penicillium viridicatum]